MQPTLVAPQSLGQLGQRHIERRIGLIGLFMATQGVAHVDLLSCYVDLHGFECRP